MANFFHQVISIVLESLVESATGIFVLMTFAREPRRPRTRCVSGPLAPEVRSLCEEVGYVTMPSRWFCEKKLGDHDDTLSGGDRLGGEDFCLLIELLNDWSSKPIGFLIVFDVLGALGVWCLQKVWTCVEFPATTSDCFHVWGIPTTTGWWLGTFFYVSIYWE